MFCICKNTKNMESQDNSIKKNRGTIVYKLALLLSAALWGCSFIFTRSLLDTEPHMTPFILMMGRLAFATLFFIPILALTHRLERIHGKDILFFLVLAFFEPFLYSIFETLGVKIAGSVLSSIVVATIPLFVPFGMALVFKERLKPLVIVGVALSLVGIVLMMLGPDMQIGTDPLGILFLSLAVLIAIAYTLTLSRVLQRYQPVTITAYQNLIGLIYFIPIVFLKDRADFLQLSFSAPMFLQLAFLGVLCSTVAYVCFNYGMKKSNPTAASVYNNLIPVFSVLLAVAIGQETLSPWTKVLGMAVVLVGLFLAQGKK